jgi:F0F1-type ATP synthase membrane subunit c/vacuolar-type H+-ATPase subunit K
VVNFFVLLNLTSGFCFVCFVVLPFLAFVLFLVFSHSRQGSAHGGIFAIRNNSMLAFVPIIIAGVLSIYGLIIAVLLVGRIEGSSSDTTTTPLTEADGYRYLAAGLANGLTCWASGWAMSKLVSMLNEKPHTTATTTSATASSSIPSTGTEPTDGLLSTPLPPASAAGAKSDDDESKFYKKMILSLIFCEAIGLYGLIVGLFLIGKK